MSHVVPMSEPLVACIPNISEGQDKSVIDAICEAASSIDGCALIGSEPDPDYNRTVITLAGHPESVRQAAFCLIQAAAELIDMRSHNGNHPRMGAVDVCPFVPIKNADAVSGRRRPIPVRLSRLARAPSAATKLPIAMNIPPLMSA